MNQIQQKPGQLLMVFIKNPILGKVKTRLAKDLGEHQALQYYQRLLEITYEAVVNLPQPKWVWYSDYIVTEDQWKGDTFHRRLQKGSDLGERMSYAFEQAFMSDYQKVVIIGSDCPEITTDLLNEAFLRLEDHDLVIGPANDGGYYLLGMQTTLELFNDINWSTEEVYAQTHSKIKKAGLSYYQLPELTDLDTVEDLKKFPEL